jgi:hypothetical protein
MAMVYKKINFYDIPAQSMAMVYKKINFYDIPAQFF